MDSIKVYEYKAKYCLADGTIKEYTVRQKKVVKNKVGQRELMESLKEITDQSKRRRIKEFIEQIKAE